ncbi:MAG: porin [Bacteroidaceae bacterium]|nr:porin [Bacteroidaceae bacterium]
MVKKLLMIGMTAMAAMPLSAQSVGEQLKQNTTFGGYVIGKVNATTQDNADVNADMGVRMARVYVDTKIGDFAMKLQMHVSGSPLNKKENSVHLVDAWAEWQHWKELRVKFGQFKRCFTFENPMHPWLLGCGTYSQLTDRLAGFNDRTGEHASNGRDFGLQLQGDLFASKRDGHRWLHYQAGVYTGQGINHADKNTRKDIIGGLWVVPVKDLQIGAFGWRGDYVRDDGTTVDRKRYSFGVNYTGDWTARAEYAVESADEGADAWYAIVGTPAWHRTKLFVRYDVYREGRTMDRAKSIYGLSAQHTFHPNLMLQANYGFLVDKTSADERYHTVDLQLYWRF